VVYELVGYNTDCRHSEDIRYRSYTSSPKIAEKFNKIPKIQFTDSGHGIVFSSREHKGIRKPGVSILCDHVDKFMSMSDKEFDMYNEIERLKWAKEYLLQRLEHTRKVMLEAKEKIDKVIKEMRGK